MKFQPEKLNSDQDHCSNSELDALLPPIWETRTKVDTPPITLRINSQNHKQIPIS